MKFYKKRYLDESLASQNPLIHYLEVGASLDYWPHPLFDPLFYKCQLEGNSVPNPLMHYRLAGYQEDTLHPHPLFRTDFYLSMYEDVRQAGSNALIDFIVNGRQMERSPHPLFDSVFYGSSYAGALTSSENLLVHYMEQGFRLDFNPAHDFDTAFYKEKNAITNDMVNPLEHYVRSKCLPKIWVLDSKVSTEPAVSIVVLSYGASYFTVDCLESIWKNTSGYDYEVIVVDNGSSQYHLRRIQKLKGPFSLIELRSNKGYSEGNNIGVEKARASIVVLLNSDTLVTSGWLDPLVADLDAVSDVGAVGAKLIYPDGRLQTAGCGISADGTPENIGFGADPDLPEFNSQRLVDYCPGAALAFKKHVFQKAGGFDLRYTPAYYEDVDLCLKLRASGLNILYEPRSVVIHADHGSTRNRKKSRFLEEVIERNRKTFVESWGEKIRSGFTTAKRS
jgi:GT2 family glycosyltransferase